MARRRAPDRFRELILAATRVFIAKGGAQRTQMSDVARELGVAKGTLYLYVEGKDALFELALRYADQEIPAEPPAPLPIPNPSPGAAARWLEARLEEDGRFPALEAALANPGPDPRAECAAIIAEIYDTLRRNQLAIRLINDSARDVPELGEIWYAAARSPLHASLTRHLTARIGAGALPPTPDPAVAARMVIESCTWFAVHRRWDPRPDPSGEIAVRDTLIETLTRSLCG